MTHRERLLELYDRHRIDPGVVRIVWDKGVVRVVFAQHQIAKAEKIP